MHCIHRCFTLAFWCQWSSYRQLNVLEISNLTSFSMGNTHSSHACVYLENKYIWLVTTCIVKCIIICTGLELMWKIIGFLDKVFLFFIFLTKIMFCMRCLLLARTPAEIHKQWSLKLATSMLSQNSEVFQASTGAEFFLFWSVNDQLFCSQRARVGEGSCILASSHGPKTCTSDENSTFSVGVNLNMDVDLWFSPWTAH